MLGSPDKYFDPTAFSLPQAGTFGNLGRSTLIGPGVTQLDGSLEKTFQVRESVRMQFRTEIFNFLNHANFGFPANSVFNSNGTYIGSAGVITTTQTTSRQIQFGLKIIF